MNNKTSVSTAYLILLTIPFFHVGYSYYISAIFALFVYCFFKSLALGRRKMFFAMVASCFCFVSKSFTGALDGVSFNEILLPLREMLCFVALINISERISIEIIDKEIWCDRILTFMYIVLGLVAYQTYKISVGEYFGIPLEYFVRNEETLIGIEDALFHETRVRPTAFFGEPSYTSFVVFSLLVIVLEISTEMRKKIKCAVIALGIVIFSQSLAGIISVVISTLYWLHFSERYRFKLHEKFLLLFFAVVSAIASVYFSDEVYLRIASSLSGGDESSNIRFTQPAALLWDVFSKGHIFGVNNKYIEVFLGTASIDNAILRLMIFYGVLAIVPILTILRYVKKGSVILYIALMLSFNGAFFVYDKVLIVALVFGLTAAKYVPTQRRTSSLGYALSA